MPTKTLINLFDFTPTPQTRYGRKVVYPSFSNMVYDNFCVSICGSNFEKSGFFECSIYKKKTIF